MPITPTVLIATSGMSQGEGIGVSSAMNDAISSATANPLVTNITTLAASANVVSGLSSILNSLPSFMTSLGPLTANIATQANAIVPPTPVSGDPAASVKSFISLHGASAGGAGALAEYSAALSTLGSKSFGDMGINSSNFHDILTQGVTSITPSLGKVAGLAAQLPLGSLGPLTGGLSGLGSASSALSGIGSMASKLGSLVPSGASITGLLGQGTGAISGALPSLTGALSSAVPSIAAGQGQSMGGLTSLFGTMGTNLNPTALAKGQAELSSNSLNDGLASAGQGLKNFGSLYDFTDLQTLGPNNMLASLQNLGLADSIGINDAIDALGSDPTNPETVPPNVIVQVFANVTDNDLAKVIDQAGVTVSQQPQTLADLLDPSFVMPAGAVAALGLSPGAAGMGDLSNTLTNLGVQGNNLELGGFMASMQTQASTYLSQLTELVPMSVQDTLKPLLGEGGGLFGNPTMSDMIGTAAGATHTEAFGNIASTLSSLMNSSVGQNLNTAITNMIAAVGTGGQSAALSALSSAVSTFNTQIASNSQLQGDITNAESSFLASQTQLTKEVANLNLVGLNLANAQPTSTGIASILNLGNKLHDYGVDKQQLGHNDLFSGVATDDLTGDAIQASLLEGRNLAKSYALGKSTPTVANESAAIKAASA